MWRDSAAAFCAVVDTSVAAAPALKAKRRSHWSDSS